MLEEEIEYKIKEGVISKRAAKCIVDFGNRRTRIHVGCMGCGKTHHLILGLGLWAMQHKPIKGYGLALVGRTQQIVKKNMCNLLSRLFGEDFKYDKSKKDGTDRDAVLFGWDIFIVGMNDASSENKIRGLSVVGILGDEVSTWTEEQYELLQSRIRCDGDLLDGEEDSLIDTAMLEESGIDVFFEGSTNPDHPKHWLKLKIEEAEKDKDNPLSLEVINWSLFDTYYKGAIKYFKDLIYKYKNNPTYYNRYILGLWSAADSIIYTEFNTNKHILNVDEFDIDLSSMWEIDLGIDFGTVHPFSITAIAKTFSGENIIFDEGTLIDGNANTQVKLVSTMMDKIRDRGGRINTIYVDSAAKSFINELISRGIDNVSRSNKAVEMGINYVKSLLDTNKLYIMSNCVDTINEFYSYSYDSKSTEFKVIKINDDHLDSVRYVLYTKHKGLGGGK